MNASIASAAAHIETAHQWIYSFGGGSADGDATMRNLLGGKGANLAEMSRIGLPVPPGFTITTEVCTHFYGHERTYPEGLSDQIDAALAKIADITGKTFGSTDNPLLLSVRSGARVSMPGMMDTVLNLGLNDVTVDALARLSGDERFACDSYRRFIQMYGDVVMGVDHELFEDALGTAKDTRGVELDTDLTADDWRALINQFKAIIEEDAGEAFPQDPFDQLRGAVGAVFKSWMVPRAITYRMLHDYPETWGTAVNVQAMVFGNMGERSATGVAFTRNPSTGEKALYGEYLINAQGEDVVAGIRTPQPLTKRAREEAGVSSPSLEEAMPVAFEEFTKYCDVLEAHYHDMQDMEFTVEDGTLWMLQTRSGKRTTKAAMKIAVDMVAEGLITSDEALMRLDPAAIDQLLHPTIDENAERQIIARGLPASPGAATGEIVLTSAAAEEAAAAGRDCILVRVETSPEDIHGMHAAKGILTARGGMTSHAAVVARGMGTPCVSGAGALRINNDTGVIAAGPTKLRAGDIITIDGASGEVMLGAVTMQEPELTGEFSAVMEWADATRRMTVRTNAETPADAETARKYGAEGIGLCRTEHMFFDGDRIVSVRQMILADDPADRQKALDKLLPMQRGDFKQLFEIMAGLPVTIRLLDPPLHEFLPRTDEEMEAVAADIGVDADLLRERTQELHEFNPMLGHRGCRLAISYPEIARMQARAIFEAAIEAGNTTGSPVEPEVMVPLVATKAEFDFVKASIDGVAEAVMAERGVTIPYTVGTMIELPRAALRAGDIAQSAQFFSFGTNDLTQTTFGISRDDAGQFLGTYERLGVMEKDPFVTLDQDGVGELVKIATERGKAVSPDMKMGICGEHGGDPASIGFCETIGLDYVSCSPFRVPIARLAAAQAALRKKQSDGSGAA
ncbi:MAG: pyruvate, phosphate dikinase [Hyphomicrobiales bacterium]|jgi:pyruvate,orthophosphate dikinase